MLASSILHVCVFLVSFGMIYLQGRYHIYKTRVIYTRHVSYIQGRYHIYKTSIIYTKYACQQYFTCMCFLGFIRYDKTFVACGFRKYENVFTHKYHIPLFTRQVSYIQDTCHIYKTRIIYTRQVSYIQDKYHIYQERIHLLDSGEGNVIIYSPNCIIFPVPAVFYMYVFSWFHSV
jgi:hypothetical protein